MKLIEVYKPEILATPVDLATLERGARNALRRKMTREDDRLDFQIAKRIFTYLRQQHGDMANIIELPIGAIEEETDPDNEESMPAPSQSGLNGIITQYKLSSLKRSNLLANISIDIRDNCAFTFTEALKIKNKAGAFDFADEAFQSETHGGGEANLTVVMVYYVSHHLRQWLHAMERSMG